MKHILILCVGNICRSPLAEALLKRELPEKNIWSAGLSAMVGYPADPLSVEVGATHGMDLSAHRAQQVVSWMCQSAELILVMERGHKTQLEKQFPLVRGKVFRLGELRKFEIADPYHQSKPVFETAYAAIELGVSQWAPRIRQLG